MSITEKILCSKSHEFLLDNGDNTFTIGLTDYAVEQLGDIVFSDKKELEFLDECTHKYIVAEIKKLIEERDIIKSQR